MASVPVAFATLLADTFGDYGSTAKSFNVIGEMSFSLEWVRYPCVLLTRSGHVVFAPYTVNHIVVLDVRKTSSNNQHSVALRK
jgi:hypothetical protein